MVTVNWRVVAIGVILFILGLLAYFVLPFFLVVPGALTPASIAFVIIAGALLILASILPIDYGKKKAILNIAYAGFFFGLITFEVNLLKPYFERVGEINLVECKSESFWVGELKDFVRITLCMFTGYELKEYTWYSVAFFITFYILLPAAFLLVFIYGLMDGLNIGFMFGKHSEAILKILSFIISLYGVRVMFGPFLLTFFAAGFWGLAGLFGAIILTQSLRKIVDSAFIVEKKLGQIKSILNIRRDLRLNFAKAASPIIRNLILSLGGGGGTYSQEFALNNIKTIRGYAHNFLAPDDRNDIFMILNDVETYVNAGRPGDALEVVRQRLIPLINNWLKSK